MPRTSGESMGENWHVLLLAFHRVMVGRGSTPPVPRHSTGTTTWTGSHSSGCPPPRTAARLSSSAACEFKLTMHLAMMSSAQRHQIVQCMGIRLPLFPRHDVVNVKELRRPTRHALVPVALKGSEPIALPLSSTPCRRVRLPARIHRAGRVLPLPRPVARHRAKRTALL